MVSRLLGLLLLFASFVSAQEAAKPLDSAKQAVVIESSVTKATFESDGTGVKEATMVMKVVSAAGVQRFAILNFTYSSAFEAIDLPYVRVRKPDGTVVNTPDYNVQDMPADVTRTAPLYSDIHEKHVAVKALAVGDTLEYQVRYRILKPEVPNQFWLEYNFTRGLLVKQETLEVSVPTAKALKVHSGDLKPEIKEANGRRSYFWKHDNLNEAPDAEEDDDEDDDSALPSVQLSTFANWQEIGTWYAGLQKDAIQPTPAITAKAAELTKGLTADEDKVRAIYNYVALNVHYVGLDFGIGRYQPHAAQDVLENSYGDCKDKHTLFAAMLKAAGYDSWPALIHDSRKLVEDVPSPAQFNHVITAVPLGGKTIWLDTTPEVAPFQLLMPTLRDKQALVMPTGKPPELMKTPVESPFPQQQIVKVEGKLSNEGVFTGHFDLTYRGDVEVIFRVAYRSTSEAQWKDLTQKIVNNMNYAGEVSNVVVSSPSELAQPFHMTFDYVRKNYTNWEQRQITPPLPPIGIEIFGYLDKAPKTNKIVLGAPGEIQYSGKLQLPIGYTMTAPKDQDQDAPYAAYHAKYGYKSGTFTYDRRFVIKQREVKKSDWKELRTFSKAVGDEEGKLINLYNEGDARASNGVDNEELDKKFRDGAEALQQRDWMRAEEIFRQIIAADPKYTGAHFNLAASMAGRSQIQDAIHEFHEEEKVTPTDQRAYRIAAALETMVGQRNDAVEDWRKLVKADPKNYSAAIQLAALLREDGNKKEATTVLEAAAKESPDSRQLRIQLALAYVSDARADEGVSILKQVVKNFGNSKSDQDALNDIAYTLAMNNAHLDFAGECAQRALVAAEKDASDAASEDDSGSSGTFYGLAQVWDTVGWIAFRNGENAKAESYLHASWLLTQNEEVGAHLGELYEREGKTKLALHQYELTLGAASVNGVGFSRLGTASFESATHKRIWARYKQLTGHEPVTSVHRKPDGTWTMSPAEELSHMREIIYSKDAGGSKGSAEFVVIFGPAGVESAKYAGGDSAFAGRAAQISKAQYPNVQLPPESKAKIARHVIYSCHAVEGCTGVLLPVQPQIRSPFLAQ